MKQIEEEGKQVNGWDSTKYILLMIMSINLILQLVILFLRL